MSSLKVDNITGRGSTGFTGSVKSEGGNTTTDLQQGLAKAWVNLNASSFGSRDTFNVAAVTDNGTGDYTYTITNDMASVNYCVPTGGLYAALQGTFVQAVGSYRLKSFGRADSLTAEDEVNFFAIFGDLA